VTTVSFLTITRHFNQFNLIVRNHVETSLPLKKRNQILFVFCRVGISYCSWTETGTTVHGPSIRR